MKFEGIVENGCVKLPEGISLADKTKVYVVPDRENQQFHNISTRLVNLEDAGKFTMNVSEAQKNAGI